MKTIVFVISDSNDKRIESLGKLFSQLVDVDCFVVFSFGSNWARLQKDGTLGSPLTATARPTQADATFVHGSDWDQSFNLLKKQLSGGFGKLFVFNGPGDPPGKPDAVRILRATQPFGLTKRDAEQLLEFAQNPTGQLPPCCAQPSRSLVALDILCQAYALAHSGAAALTLSDRQIKATESREWWMKCLGVSSLEELESGLNGEAVEPIVSQAILDAFLKAQDKEDIGNAIEALSSAIKKGLQ